MHAVQIYALIASLLTSLVFITKTRHPHVKHLQGYLADYHFIKFIKALDFYAGNRGVYYNTVFTGPVPDIQALRGQCPTPLKCPQPVFPPYCAEMDSRSKMNMSDSVYHWVLSLVYILRRVLVTTVFAIAAFIVGKASYKGLGQRERIALSETASYIRNMIERKRDIWDAGDTVENRLNGPKCTSTPSSSVAVVARANNPIYYPQPSHVVVAPPVPMALSSSRSQEPAIPFHDFAFRIPQPVIEAIASELCAPPISMIAGALRRSHSNREAQDSRWPSHDPRPTVAGFEDVGRPFASIAGDGELALEFLAQLPFAQDLAIDKPSSTSLASQTIWSQSPSPRRHKLGQGALRPALTPRGSCGHCGRPPSKYQKHLIAEDASVNDHPVHPTPDIATAMDPPRDANGTRARPLGTQGSAKLRQRSSSLDSPLQKLRVARVRATTAPAQLLNVTGFHWEQPQCTRVHVSFVSGRTGADLVRAMATSMPEVIDLAARTANGSQRSETRTVAGDGQVGAGVFLAKDAPDAAMGSQCVGVSQEAVYCPPKTAQTTETASTNIITAPLLSRRQSSTSIIERIAPGAAQVLRRVVAAADTAAIRPKVGRSGSGSGGMRVSTSTGLVRTPSAPSPGRGIGNGEGAKVRAPGAVRRVGSGTGAGTVHRRILGPGAAARRGGAVGATPVSPDQRPPMRVTRIFGPPPV
ncbi:hypothetical protein DXG01_006166 [Tephrocybe rancida]|nr:hypothetical protein DXG01_006166 [Tephrocybe rancida]